LNGGDVGDPNFQALLQQSFPNSLQVLPTII
jgi:hypothetical protein